MKTLRFFCLLVTLLLVAFSCEKDRWSEDPAPVQVLKSNLISPKIKIAVISDIHYMHPDLLPARITDSPSLMADLGMDRKVYELSDPIFREVIDELSEENPDILLVPGDLARDGELINHQLVQGLLQSLENHGTRVYVIPGNNDILNPDAMSYVTEPPVPVANIDGTQFSQLYGNFGYNEALYRDASSLSYICQPYSNLWVLGIDNNEYITTENGLEVNGAINPLTMEWIVEKMAEARENNITVLAMMHHGILKHYSAQEMVEPLIADAEEKAIALLNAGIHIIFTGHYHANDIAEFNYNGSTLYDIETGSLVTPPLPYRVMELDDNFLKIQTSLVTSVDTDLTGELSFSEYCDVNLTGRLNSLFEYILINSFGLPEQYAVNVAPRVSNAYKAYFAGDEKIPVAEQREIDALPESLGLLVSIIESVWTDLEPSDNDIHIKLK